MEKYPRVVNYLDKIDKEWDDLILFFIEKYKYKLHFSLISNSPNIKMFMIDKYIDLPWNFNKICKNPNLTIEFVKKYYDRFSAYGWRFISSNSNIKMIDIENNINLDWNFEYVSMNKNLNLKFVKKNINFNWNHFEIIKNDSIIPKDYYREIGKIYCYYSSLMNKNLTIREINMDQMNADNINKMTYHNTNKKLILEIKDLINFEILNKDCEDCNSYEKNYKINFNPRELSRIKYLPLNIIDNYPNLNWDWRMISRNENINIEFVKKYINKNWNWYSINANIPLELNTIENNLNFPWLARFLSSNNTLTFEMIKYYRNTMDWCWDEISANSNISIETIYNNPRYPWIWSYVSFNQNIKMSYIIDYLDNYKTPIVLYSVCFNFFINEKQEFIENKKKEYISAMKIKKWYKNIIYNPRNKYGIKFLEKKFSDTIQHCFKKKKKRKINEIY